MKYQVVMFAPGSCRERIIAKGIDSAETAEMVAAENREASPSLHFRVDAES